MFSTFFENLPSIRPDTEVIILISTDVAFDPYYKRELWFTHLAHQQVAKCPYPNNKKPCLPDFMF